MNEDPSFVPDTKTLQFPNDNHLRMISLQRNNNNNQNNINNSIGHNPNSAVAAPLTLNISEQSSSLVNKNQKANDNPQRSSPKSVLLTKNDWNELNKIDRFVQRKINSFL